MRVARYLALSGVLLACTVHERPTSEKAVEKAEPKPEQPKVEVKAEPKPEPKPEAKPEPPPLPKPPPPPTQAAEIITVPGTTEWKELPGLSDIDGFYPFVIGVLAKCGPDGAQWCKLYDDGRLEVDDVGIVSELAHLDDHRIWGVWRSDAWRIVFDTREDETDDERASIALTETLKVERWRGDGFAVQRSFEAPVDVESHFGRDDPRSEVAILARKGWAGGMLVHVNGFVRVPDSGPTPTRVSAPPNMLEFFEAESGALFIVVGERPTDERPGGQLRVMPPCADGSCSDQIFELPRLEEDSSWEFPLDVARGGDSLTIVVEDDGEEFLLHYDQPEVGLPGGWSFDALPAGARTRVIWPDTRGGLWIAVDEALWYRSKAGRWFDVALPGEVIDFANRLKPREFLALIEGPDGNRVFATRGPVKPAPATQP